MMNIWKNPGGTVKCKLISADTAAAITAINNAGIVLYRTTQDEDPLCIQLTVSGKDLRKLIRLTNKRGEQLSVYGKSGIYYSFLRLLARPVICAAILLLLIMACFLPTRVFFFRVEGNVSVPTNLILDKCEQIGICFGANRRQIRSEKVKNALLEAIPQLQWAGINTSGCVATISVQERAPLEEQDSVSGVSSIVARCDGIITDLTVVRGSQLCKVGQAVTAGEVLISGYTDCNISIRAEAAQGEVYAKTKRTICAVMPSETTQKGKTTGQTKKYALIIGKKRINLYKDSGISDTVCDKMYSEKYITLPGGFALPVAIVTEVWTYRDYETQTESADSAQKQLADFAKDYLLKQMVAGQILTEQTNLSDDSDRYCLYADYACIEMIGAVRNEEIITPHG